MTSSYLSYLVGFASLVVCARFCHFHKRGATSVTSSICLIWLGLGGIRSVGWTAGL